MFFRTLPNVQLGPLVLDTNPLDCLDIFRISVAILLLWHPIRWSFAYEWSTIVQGFLWGPRQVSKPFDILVFLPFGSKNHLKLLSHHRWGFLLLLNQSNTHVWWHGCISSWILHGDYSTTFLTRLSSWCHRSKHSSNLAHHPRWGWCNPLLVLWRCKVPQYPLVLHF